MSMLPWLRVSSPVLAAVTRAVVAGALLGAGGCAPIPDFKVTARDIPAGTTHLLVSMLDDKGTPPQQSLAIPISDEQRSRLLIGLTLPPGAETAVLSLATVDADRCITSVLPATRVSGRGAQPEVILDPAQNPSVVPLNSTLLAPASCPKVTIGEGLLVPREPRIINVIRDFRMMLPAVQGGVNLYGWGFDHSSLEMGRAASLSIPVPDEMCLSNTILKALVQAPCADPLSYPPSAVTYVSYGQLTLDFTRIRSACPQASDVQILSSAAFNAYAYTVRNPDGSSAAYRESGQGVKVQ